jgi:outer membrane cobalamin receptor
VAAGLAFGATHSGVAQRPGEIAGTVIDAMTGEAVEGVNVVLLERHRMAVTDAAGRFMLRSIDSGSPMLELRRLGFATRHVTVMVRNGETVRPTIRLVPAPVALDALETVVERTAAGTRIDEAAIRRSGARTAGDAIRDVTGVVVRSSGPGSPQLATMRGMAADAVLVLVDGVPLNDPVTGEADLSLVDASAVSAITVLPGAQSARWGPRAAAGVIHIETHGTSADRRIEAGAGSLGMWDASIAWGGGRSAAWTAGASVRGQRGAFDYELPDEVGGGAGRRANADVRTTELHAGAGFDLGGGELTARAGWEVLERGLPGRSFAPSRHARQEHDRLRGSLTWRRAGEASTVSALFAGARQSILHSDANPAFGLPYSDTTRVDWLETRIDADRAFGPAAKVGAGVELRHQHIGGTVLEPGTPEDQLDAGVFAHGTLPLAEAGGVPLRLAGQVRLDRDPIDGGIVASHSVMVGWMTDHLEMHVAHRSSYSPPTPGDRFFRDEVGVEPNPDLRAERVPGEIEAGASLRGSVADWALSLRATAYRGDIDGMIFWAPDYRFIWSPSNQDARRTGVEASAELSSPRNGMRLSGSWTYARATYDRGPADDDVQIAYRPRQSGTLSAWLNRGPTTVGATLRYTGDRTTSPSRFNTLPAFWTVDFVINHSRQFDGGAVTFDLRMDRVFDNDASLIFGFPEPGRTVRAGVRITPAGPIPLLTNGVH